MTPSTTPLLRLLASKAIHSNTLTFRFSPTEGFEFKAEGVRP